MMQFDAKQALEKARAEIARRKSCPRHHFEVKKIYQLGDKLPCTVCGASMRLSEIGMYQQGYAAAGGDPDDILRRGAQA